MRSDRGARSCERPTQASTEGCRHLPRCVAHRRTLVSDMASSAWLTTQVDAVGCCTYEPVRTCWPTSTRSEEGDGSLVFGSMCGASRPVPGRWNERSMTCGDDIPEIDLAIAWASQRA